MGNLCAQVRGCVGRAFPPPNSGVIKVRSPFPAFWLHGCLRLSPQDFTGLPGSREGRLHPRTPVTGPSTASGTLPAPHMHTRSHSHCLLTLTAHHSHSLTHHTPFTLPAHTHPHTAHTVCSHSFTCHTCSHSHCLLTLIHTPTPVHTSTPALTHTHLLILFHTPANAFTFTSLHSITYTTTHSPLFTLTHLLIHSYSAHAYSHTHQLTLIHTTIPHSHTHQLTSIHTHRLTHTVTLTQAHSAFLGCRNSSNTPGLRPLHLPLLHCQNILGTIHSHKHRLASPPSPSPSSGQLSAPRTPALAHLSSPTHCAPQPLRTRPPASPRPTPCGTCSVVNQC